ncbi:MAG: DUF2306 domain-containing protein [Planctomycetales bacterium]|nr:DUF2306 domain-containing protein [Planctomycetales bacterium]
MVKDRSTTLRRVLAVAAGPLIVKVTVEVMLGYVNYFPPNFDSDFLRGREGYFFGAYRRAFYPHIASGPVALGFGMVLLSETFRRRFPKWHRILGRLQTANVLCVVTPSGLWMAYHTSTGTTAAIGFAILAILTGTCIALGWRAAVKRQFAIHRRWMWRCFLLLCSAVVLRIIVGFGNVIEVQALWFDPAASWASWILPLTTFELIGLKLRRKSRSLAPSVSAYPAA